MTTDASALNSREIRVFLSSTFKDMDAERNHLIKQVFPKVRAACLERQVGFTEIDLRWGVTEEESKNGATVEICLKEIDRCRDFPPFFIGFLGERYGWVPVHEVLATYWEKNKDSRYAINIQNAIQRGISVTELEMELAVLQDGASEKIAGHALFMLRSATFTHELYVHAKSNYPDVRELDYYDAGGDKLAALKQRISQSGFLDQNAYTSVEQFGTAIETYLLAQLDHYFPAETILSSLQLRNAAHAAFRFHRLQNFLPRIDLREQMVAEISRRVNEPALGTILVRGPSGQGKSALMADLAQYYQTQLSQHWRVIDHYVGADNISTLDDWVTRILQTLHPDIKDLVGDLPDTRADKAKALSTWISMAAQRHQCRYLLVIDALDQLGDLGLTLELLNPEILGPDGYVIVSAAHGAPVIEAAARWQTHLELPALTTELRIRFVADTLARYRKRLPDELTSQLVSAPQSGSPLFLGLALEALRVDARHESLASLVTVILTQPDAQQLFLNNFLLDADVGRIEEPELAARFMAYIGAARAGLSEQELADLLARPEDPVAEDTGRPRLPQIHLSRLLVNFAPFLLNKRGRRTPMHRIFGLAALLHQKEDSVRRYLYDYFAKGYGEDGIAVEARAATEALFQITALAELAHDKQAPDRTHLIEDLGRLGLLVSIYDEKNNDAGKLILTAIDLLCPDEKIQVSASWGHYINALDADDVYYYAEEIRDFGRWLRVWAKFEMALSVLKPLLEQHVVLKPLLEQHVVQQTVVDEDYADGCDALGTLYLELKKFDFASPLLTKALAIREDSCKENPQGTAASLNNLASLLESTEDYAAAERLLRRALEILMASAGLYDTNTAIILNNLASLLCIKGDYSAAEHIYRDALMAIEKVRGPEHTDTASVVQNLAEVLQNTGSYIAAEPLFRRALAIYEKKLGHQHPDTANCLNSLAAFLQITGNYVEAEVLNRQALNIYETTFGVDHPNTATTINNLAELFRTKGDYSAAEPLYHRALTITEKSLGPDHSDVAIKLCNLARLLETKGDYSAAKSLNLRALTIYEKSLGPDHPATARILNNLAVLLKYTGDYAGAEPMLQRALTIFEISLGQDHTETAKVLVNLADILEAKGNCAGAESMYRRALAISEKALGELHPDVATSLVRLANFLCIKGDYVGAKPLLYRALDIREICFGPEHDETGSSLNSLALLYQTTADFYAAEPLYRRALAIAQKSLGPEHINTLVVMNNLAVTLQELGKTDEASVYFTEENDIRRRSTSSTTPQGFSMRLTETLKQWLKEQEWNEDPEVDEEKQTSSTGFVFTVGDFSLKCWFDINEKGEIFKFFAYFFNTKVPEKKLDEVQKFVTAVSNNIVLGNLQLLREERIIRYYNAIDVEDAAFEPAHITNLFKAGLRIMEDGLPRFMAICFGGKTAEEALKEEDE